MKFNELYEQKKHGSIDFPLQYYRVDEFHPQYVMQPHWHRELEIIFIKKGNFRLIIQNNEYRLFQGDIAFISCGSLHRGEPEDSVYEVAVIDLNMLLRRHDDIVNNLIIPIVSGEKLIEPLLLFGDNDRLYSSVISFFNVLKNKEEYYKLSVYSLLFEIISRLYSLNKIIANPVNRKLRHRAEIVAALIDWVDEHYKEYITLKKLSSVSGMNEKYLCQIFREFTEYTPIEYVNSIRIEKACLEMKLNRKTVTEAAIDSGFNDPNYFTRVFKKHKGITPKKYVLQGAEKSTDCI